MNEDRNYELLHEYLEERFGRVHDRLDALEENVHTDITEFGKRITATEAKIESVNGRIWTVGAIVGAMATGLGALVSWLTLQLGLAGWIRKA